MGKRGKRGRSKGYLRLLRLCAREDWTCYLCGQYVPLNADHHSPMSASREHVIPKYRIGKKQYTQKQLQNNCKLAHKWCNERKGRRMNPPDTDTYPEGLIDAQLAYEVKQEQ